MTYQSDEGEAMSDEPVFVFGERVDVLGGEDMNYWPEDYARMAVKAAESLGWTTRPATGEDYVAAQAGVEAVGDWDLDEADTYRFGAAWGLRSTGLIGDVPGLDDQLRDWRHWEETDHLAGAADLVGEEPVLKLPDWS